MESSFLTQWLSDHEMKAICWTLIHSLWIGLIIAALAGLVISVTRKSGAALRYRLLCRILVLFVLSVSIAFYFQIRSVGQGAVHTGQGTAVVNYGQNQTMISAGSREAISPVKRAVDFLNLHIDVIFLVWLLFFVFKSLKLAGGLLYIQRIRNYKVHPVTEELKHKIDLFARQIGIRQKIHLVQSELVKVPAVVGWLKPVILLPMGIILQLPAEQLESILWHELAHIYRRDYLVNILQGLVETIFFFNPGLLWLSSLIRAEREACCDDMVLSRMNRKANYLEALLAVGNEDNSRLALAMSIGSANQMRDRLLRIVNKENKRLSMTEKVVLVAGLIVLSAFTGLPTSTKYAVQQLFNVIIKQQPKALSNTVAGYAVKGKTPTPQKSGASVMDTLHNKIDSLVNLKSKSFKRSGFDSVINDITAEDINGKKYHFFIAGNKLVAMDINGEKVKDNDLPKYGYIIRLFQEQERAYAAALASKFKADKEYGKQRYLDSLLHKPSNASLKPEDMNAMSLKLEGLRQRWREDSVSYSAQRQRAHNVIIDLVNANAAPDDASVKWFGLTETALIVNGQKQPDALHDQLMHRYSISKGNGLFYGPVKMNGTGVFVGDAAQNSKQVEQ